MLNLSSPQVLLSACGQDLCSQHSAPLHCIECMSKHGNSFMVSRQCLSSQPATSCVSA